MGAVQSLMSSEGAAAAGTLVFAGALGYSVTKLAKQEPETRGAPGGEKAAEKGETGGGKKKGKKQGAGDGAVEVKAAPTSTSTAQVIPGSFDAPTSGPSAPAADTDTTTGGAKSKPRKGKTKQVSRGPAASPSTAQTSGVDLDGGSVPSTLPNEAQPPTASTSRSKSKKSKKKKNYALGATTTGGAGASVSSLALPSANANASTTGSSTSKTGEASAVVADVAAPPVPSAGGEGEGANTAPRGSKSRDTLIPGDTSSTEDEDDDDGDDGDEKPFLTSLSLSGSKRLPAQHPMGLPKSGSGSGPSSFSLPGQQKSQHQQAYSDTDNSWTHVRRVGRHKHPSGNTSSLAHHSTSAAELTTSDAGVVSSMTDDGYPSSSPMVERVEVTEDEEGEAPAHGLGSGSPYVRASSSNDGSGTNPNTNTNTNTVTQRKTLAERILPKPRKTGVEDMLETPDHPTLTRVVRVRPLPGEKPPTGFSWADYEDVHIDEGAGHDADGEDDGWGVVRSRRSRSDRAPSSTVTGTGGTDAGGGGTSQSGKAPGTATTKKQRQHAKKREATKTAKAEAETQRLATLAKHKQQLENMRIMEQISKKTGKTASGGMTASVDDNGNLVWE
ncbi:hypothetical protein AX15_001465 [Amanita polypyramis BW_CC]|nr:hypothetical protein AX15_001465 [Amanita polypyramis BW_CC]